MEQWYALYTKPNAEYRVATALRQQEIETFLPQIEATQAGKERRNQPFFPNYLFMRVDMGQVKSSQWQWTPGLRRIVSFEQQPVVIPEEAIDLIQDNLAAFKAKKRKNSTGFKAGDKVRIKKGSFADMIAIFDRPSSAADRVRVLLNFLGRLSGIQVDLANIEKAPANARVENPQRPRRTRGRGRRIKN